MPWRVCLFLQRMNCMMAVQFLCTWFVQSAQHLRERDQIVRIKKENPASRRRFCDGERGAFTYFARLCVGGLCRTHPSTGCDWGASSSASNSADFYLRSKVRQGFKLWFEACVRVMVIIRWQKRLAMRSTQVGPLCQSRSRLTFWRSHAPS